MPNCDHGLISFPSVRNNQVSFGPNHNTAAAHKKFPINGGNSNLPGFAELQPQSGSSTFLPILPLTATALQQDCLFPVSPALCFHHQCAERVEAVAKCNAHSVLDFMDLLCFASDRFLWRFGFGGRLLGAGRRATPMRKYLARVS